MRRSHLICLIAALVWLPVGTGCSAESKKARILQSAESYLRKGEYEKARIEFLNLEKLDPQNPAAAKGLGITWFEQGAPMRALPYLVKARSLAPDDLESRSKLSLALMSAGAIDDARKEAVAVLEKSPGEEKAIGLLADTARTPEEVAETNAKLAKFPDQSKAAWLLASGRLALVGGRTAEAEDLVGKAFAADPKSAPVHTFLAVIHLLKKERDKAGEELRLAAELSPVRSGSRLQYAEFLAQTGDVQGAKEYLLTLTRQAPDFLPAWRSLGQLALATNEPDEAMKRAEEVLRQDAENIDGQVLKGQILLAKGQAKPAIEIFERLDAAFPNVPLIKQQLGRAWAQTGNLPKAIALIDPLVRANPNDAESALMLAELNLRGGQAAAAVTTLTAVIEKLPVLAPQSLPRAKTLLVEAYRGAGRLDEAASMLRQQITAMPKDPQPHLLLGVILRQQNKPAEARDEFGRALELAPDDMVVHSQLVEMDLVEKNFEGAKAKVGEMKKRKPDDAMTHYVEGRLHLAQGESVRAVTALRKAIELDPGFTLARDLLVTIYLTDNNFDGAIRELDAALTRDPANNRARMSLALAYERNGDHARARDAYHKILETAPDNVAAMNNLAYLYAERFNELEKAYELARNARAAANLPPDLADRLTDTFGWILYRRGEYLQAATLLKEAATKQPEDLEIQYHHGMAAYMMGHADEARAALQRAAEAKGDFPGKAEIAARLAVLGNKPAEGASPERSVAEWEALTKAHPNDVIVGLGLAAALEKQKDFARAAAAYEKVLAVNPQTLSAVMSLATLHAGPLEKPQSAYEFARKARELAPNDPAVAGAMGAVGLKSGHYSWAYSLLEESARQRPGDAPVLHDLAWAAYSLGKVKEARETMRRALDTSPEGSLVADARRFLTVTEYHESPAAAAAATAEIQRALDADRDYTPAIVAGALAALERRDSKAAADGLRRVLDRFPEFAPAQKYLARIEAEVPEKLAGAHDLATKARKTLPDDPELAEILGQINYRRAEYPLAIQFFDEAAARRTPDPQALFYVGMARFKSNDHPRAREALQRALAGGLPDPLATEARATLSQLNSAAPAQ